jgi:hypothetical protein
MTRRIAALGDRMLTRFLPRSTAGACVQQGPCSYTEDGHCSGNYFLITTCTGLLSCHGLCNEDIVCTEHKAGTC